MGTHQSQAGFRQGKLSEDKGNNGRTSPNHKIFSPGGQLPAIGFLKPGVSVCQQALFGGVDRVPRTGAGVDVVKEPLGLGQGGRGDGHGEFGYWRNAQG